MWNILPSDTITDSTGIVENESLWGNEKPVARKTNNAWYYYIYNAHSDVVGLVNESGVVENTYEYDAWGAILTETGSIDNPIKYAGEYYDEELDMYYLRARYYDPQIKRFTSYDIEEGEILNPLDMNRYVYCRNNPVKYVDPSGESVTAYGITGSVGIGFAGYEGMYLWATDNKGNFALIAVNGYASSVGASLGCIGIYFPSMPDISYMYGYGFGLTGSLNGWGAGVTFGGDKGQYSGFVIQGGIGGEADVWLGGDGAYTQPIISGNIHSISSWTRKTINKLLPKKLQI